MHEIPSIFKLRGVARKTQQGVGQNVVCSLGINIMNKVDSTTQRGKSGKGKTFYFISLSTGNREWRSEADSPWHSVVSIKPYSLKSQDI